MYNDELYHYGVKGMKWGRRKSYKGSKLKKNRKKPPLTEEQKAYRDAAIYAGIEGVGAAIVSNYLGKRVTTIDPYYINLGSVAIGSYVAANAYVNDIERYEKGK